MVLGLFLRSFPAHTRVRVNKDAWHVFTYKWVFSLSLIKKRSETLVLVVVSRVCLRSVALLADCAMFTL